MEFDLDNRGTWFFFDPAQEELGGVCLRICAGDDIVAIEKQAVKPKVEYKRGGRFSFKETNEPLYNRLLWDFCIVDWKEVSVDGESVECTRDNKIKLMMKSVDFATFVGDCLDDLTAAKKQIDKDAEKNL